jgi:hypothetical protein
MAALAKELEAALAKIQSLAKEVEEISGLYADLKTRLENAEGLIAKLPVPARKGKGTTGADAPVNTGPGPAVGGTLAPLDTTAPGIPAPAATAESV